MIENHAVLGTIDFEKSRELVNAMLRDEIDIVLDSQKDAEDYGGNFVYYFFPKYLKDDVEHCKECLLDLQKRIDSKDIVFPTLEQEYAINEMISDMKETSDVWDETLKEYFPNGYTIPTCEVVDDEIDSYPIYEDFWENFWECCFCDMDYTLLNRMTLDEIKKSPVNAIVGIC